MANLEFQSSWCDRLENAPFKALVDLESQSSWGFIIDSRKQSSRRSMIDFKSRPRLIDVTSLWLDQLENMASVTNIKLQPTQRGNVVLELWLSCRFGSTILRTHNRLEESKLAWRLRCIYLDDAWAIWWKNQLEEVCLTWSCGCLDNTTAFKARPTWRCNWLEEALPTWVANNLRIHDWLEETIDSKKHYWV